MGSIAYMDFDLLIHRDEAGYSAQVLNSPAGQARVTFSMPFSDLEFENLPLRMGCTRGGVRRIDSADVAAAKIFGGRLFTAVFDGEVLGCLRSSLDEANRQDAGLRIRLRLTDVPELADLPWEYLYNPTLNRFLALSVETPIVRYLDLPQRIRPLAVTPPLRVLAMISSPDDYPPLDVEQEWAKLHEALSDLEQEDLVTVERLDEATLASLLPRLQRGEYHVFHFIGHGGFDQQAQDGVLILEGGKRRGRPVSGQDLGTLLRDHRPMRLAVLNACEGARTSSTDPFAGTAQSLIQQGVPAVIAMQFAITDEAAITFANTFYGAVARGYPVDAGLAEARKAIFAQGNSLEWGTPVLYMRAPDGRIFDVKQVSNEERRRLRLAALYREAQTALAREDWATATEQLQALLRLEPTHAEAQARLHEVRQQQELATWYATGQQHCDAGQWQAALEAFRRAQERGGNYKDVEALLATAQRELTRVRDEEQRRLRLAALYREAQTALAREEWTAATEQLQALLRLEPTHAEAQAQLHEAQARLHEAQRQQATRIQFTAYYPKEVRPETWYMLPAYAHLPEALEAVQSDSRTRLGPQAGNADQGRSQATLTIARGAEIVVVPELPGCRFNPPRAGFLWLEDWHRAEFHMQATPDQPGFVLGQAVNGRVAFYVGPVLVAEVAIETHFRAEADVSAADLPDFKVTTDPYQRIFLSYSHQDALVAQQVEQAYTVLGMQSLRDVHALRSGEEWYPALLRHIEQADIFQLYWSNNAKRSTNVEHEWRHALTQTRPSFIRPLYWEQPMPDPPPELAAIHFAYFPLDQLCTKSLVRNLTHRLIRAFWSIFERSLRLKRSIQLIKNITKE